MSRSSEGWRASRSSSLFTLDSTGHCKTVLNNDGFCQLFNTRPPFPSLPLCNHFINSLASLSSPFTEQAHNKTHSVTLCIFTPSLLALDETASPSQLAPLGAFFDVWGGVGPVLWLSDLSCCQKEVTAQHSQGQQAVALEGAAAVSWLLQTEGSHSVCKTSQRKSERFKILTSPALLTQRKAPERSRRTHLRVICLLLMGTVLNHSPTQDHLC